MMLAGSPSRRGNRCQISSVMYGMNGCSSFRSWSRTKTSTARVEALASSSVPYSAPLLSSMYQSQNSPQANW